MTEELKKTIEEKVAKLPREVQDAINSFDWVKKAEEIGKDNLLTDEEINDFQVETLLVLVGLMDPEFYAVNIENNVGATKEKAGQIANIAVQKIFIPIENIMEEKIKSNLKNKEPSWRQSVEFILSGGNYFAFLTPATSPKNNIQEVPVKPPTLQDIKDKLLINDK